jgi:hypothetical protein
MHVIAAKAVAFGEALRPEFKDYQAQVIANAQALADQLMKGGLDIVTGGTDTHLMLVDLRPKGVKGNATEKALGRAHITCNKNGIPFDTEKPMITSGVRLGSPRAPRAASARRSSARSATGSWRWSKALPPMAKTATAPPRPRSRAKSLTFAEISGLSQPLSPTSERSAAGPFNPAVKARRTLWNRPSQACEVAFQSLR